jgi:hypothetical protein
MSGRKRPELLREIARRIGSFALVLGLGFALWPVLSAPFTVAFRATANAVVGAARFGKGGHALFLSAAPRQHESTGRDTSWDAPLELGIEGVEKKHVVSVNPRRIAFIPWLCFAALVAAAPLRRSAKLKCLALGSTLLALAALASVWIIIAWIFARVPGLVYDLESWQRALLDLAYEALVTPMGNKFVLPLLLAAGLVLWQMREQASAGSEPAGLEDDEVVPAASLAVARRPANPRRARRRRRR